MLKTQRLPSWQPYLFMAAFFAASIAIRPLLPVDETRYLSVAWEMFSRKSFLVPTLNFEPYFQKPPLLFWLIDGAWAIFGVSRPAAMIVVFGISSAVIVLAQRVAAKLFPDRPDIDQRMPWLMLGSVAFVIYSSLILFDLLLTALVLGFFLSMIAFSERGRWRNVLLAGACVGLALLTKGPVALIHCAFPIAMYRLWRPPGASLPAGRFFAGAALAVLVAFAVALLWLVPAVGRVGETFGYNLVWEQAFGRVSGSMPGAHARPFYFYLLLLPVVLLPWALTPELWRSDRPVPRLRDRADVSARDLNILKFCVAWCVGALVVFSAISGKQPHYLLPLVPIVTIVFAYLMNRIPLARIRITTVAMLALCAIGQLAVSGVFFSHYDLAPVARFLDRNRQADLAFAGSYQGELTFLARLEKPLEIVDWTKISEWLRQHPNGYLIARAPGTAAGGESVGYSQLVENSYFVVLNASKQAAVEIPAQ